ncbi:hypothetical protein with ribonuclease H-like domain and integrase-like domain [Klebsormidium nitens]|uniref:Integrase catalytic domain-containing protein n=1 Tax=Klebsormidium nitens TaxID=105231 RepID=A0A1Y1IT49_KLENI|nr:hypothetical protein with ribonuclease H-like domain and integrase-like domain [Klebsormidium nitens]|eukprot:GAQ92481.1 hypothetical protein with ribonuclease H-like domain and integrase-like domain [Klebsormidium nitens]
MYGQVQHEVAACTVCDRVKATFDVKDPELKPLPIMGMFYRWGVDVCKMPRKSDDGNRYVVVMVEHFTKWIELRAIPAKKAKHVAAAFRDVLTRFGAPAEVVTDQGREFEGEFDELMIALSHGATCSRGARGTQSAAAEGVAGAGGSSLAAPSRVAALQAAAHGRTTQKEQTRLKQQHPLVNPPPRVHVALSWSKPASSWRRKQPTLFSHDGYAKDYVGKLNRVKTFITNGDGTVVKLWKTHTHANATSIVTRTGLHSRPSIEGR